MQQLPDARIVHQTNGRIRFRLDALRGDNAFFENVGASLLECPEVTNLEISSATASILVSHEGNTDDVTRYAIENRLFTVSTSQKPENQSCSTTVAAGCLKNLEAVAGDITVPKVVACALIGMSCYQIYRGNLKAPAWYTALWYAYNLFRGDGEKLGN